MKTSRLRSASTFRLFATIAAVLFVASFFISCASGGGKSSKPASTDEIPDELSLKADRSALEDARKDVPEDVRRDNDELAGLLQMIEAKPNQAPGEIRERFNKAVRDRREKSDKILRKRREDFDKTERRTREAFLKKLKDERDDYVGDKHTSDERKEFFDSQEDRRKDFFATQSDQRHDFDGKLNEDRKAFNDYIKEKTDLFNEEMRAYTTAYYDRKKNEALQKEAREKARTTDHRDAAEPAARSGGQPDELDEFSTIPKGPGIRLGTPSDKAQ